MPGKLNPVAIGAVFSKLKQITPNQILLFTVGAACGYLINEYGAAAITIEQLKEFVVFVSQLVQTTPESVPTGVADSLSAVVDTLR